jgi:hypothetical protein
MIRTVGIGLAVLLAAASGSVNAQQAKSHFGGRGLDIARIDGQPVTGAKPTSRLVTGEVFVKLPSGSRKVVRTRALLGVRPPKK